MPRIDPAFKERLYEEYGLRARVRLIILLSAFLYLLFLVLDRITARQFFREFLIIRLTVLAAHIVLYLLLTRVRTQNACANIAVALAICDVAGISLMIYLLGGFVTSYVQGLYIIIIGLVVAVPLTFRDTALLYVFIWTSYAIPSFLNMPPGGWADVINNLFFISSMIIIGAFGSFSMDAIRRRELTGRIDLEALTEKLRESNIKLKSLDELKTQFFANVSHELRTPLTLMLAPLAPVLEGRMGPLTASQKDTIETIQRNGYKLLRLINNLLDLTKLEEGKTRLKIREVNFTEYLSAILASVKPTADERRLKLFFQHPPQAVELTIDPEQFEKIILNLLSNALKFTPKGGRITVYVEEKDTTVVMTVEDTGEGIPADKLEAIFDRFSQVDGSSTRRHEGTGIGLSLAREIVNLHGGAIRAESEVGRGSRFIVELLKGDAHYPEENLDRRHEDQPVPIKRRVTDAEGLRLQDIVSDFRRLQLVDLEHVDTTAGDEGVGRHENLLLVIDDNPEVLKLMRILLSDEYDLESASSAEAGLRLLRERTPDLVLCDVMMPGMDGHAFARHVKDDPDLKHIPIMLVTARTGAEMIAQGVAAGADDYISKPFDSVELKARIRSLLRMRQVESELALVNRNLKMRASDLVDQQRSLFLSMIKSLVSAIDAKDEYTRHHSTRVTEFTLKIARQMGFSEHELKDLELAALLHDVGKIAVPETILNKRSALTPEEFASVKEHPARGESILRPVAELRQIATIVRHHHERYDGTGYPDGLKSQEIPIGARIMAVADAYDSIVSERPYRKGASHKYAVKEIIRCSGQHFDPEVVEHFLEISSTIAAEENGGRTTTVS